MTDDASDPSTRRRLVMLVVAGALLLLLLRPALLRADEDPAPPRRPNIVLILADDQGYAETGVQGCADVPTPHIDSIAAEGVRFTDGYVSCPVCAPTRAGLLTGRYQQRFGFELNPGPERSADPEFGLPRDQATVAERLKKLGYATGMVGKWHLGYREGFRPTERGFDEFFGFLSGANSFFPGRRAGRSPILRGTEVVEEEAYLTDAFGREAAAFIEKHREHPFFLYLPFNAVHAPLQATEESRKRFPEIEDERRLTYAGMTASMDDAVGLVLAALERFGLEENTLVFYLSDNGGPTRQTTSRNDPLRGFKGQVYEGGIRIPYMVRWKGRLPAGAVCGAPVTALDIHPTLLAAANGEPAPEEKLDGVNLLPFLCAETLDPPHDILDWRFGAQQAVRRGSLKLVLGPGSEQWELYDLSSDVGEATDLAAVRPKEAAELAAAWEAWNAELEDPRWRRQGGRRRGTKAGRTGKSVEERFRAFDMNGDGELTPGEVPRKRLFRRMDANEDGVVTLEEAKAALRRK